MKNKGKSPFVYSTDPNWQVPEEEVEDVVYPAPEAQQVRIRLETKHRGGKMVTLVENFKGSVEAEETLGKQLRNFCGAGGRVKDGEILVQGDHRDKMLQWFLKNGYAKTKKSN